MNKCAKCSLDLSLSHNIYIMNNKEYCEECYHKIALARQKDIYREMNHLPRDYGEDCGLDNFGTTVHNITRKV